ncbi:MAG: OmpA family protein [Phycisphaerae bacterium]
MPRAVQLLLAFTALVLAGCASGSADRSPEPTRGAALPNDSPALASERAKVVALQKRLDEELRASETSRAEAAAYRQRLDQLMQRNAELVAATEQRPAPAIQRPSADAPALPASTDQALRELAGALAGRVWYDSARAAVSFANDRLFDPGSDEVRADGREAVARLGRVLRDLPAGAFDVVVVGHTDDRPIGRGATAAKHPTNWHLSAHRAIAVKDALVAAGVSEARVGVMGYGAARPLGSDDAMNRRVEVFLVRAAEVRSFSPVAPR